MTIGEGDSGATLRVNEAELDLIRTALRLLLSTLGKEEAEEIDEIQAVLARIPETPSA